VPAISYGLPVFSYWPSGHSLPVIPLPFIAEKDNLSIETYNPSIMIYSLQSLSRYNK
jgi:hypothetical protein